MEVRACLIRYFSETNKWAVVPEEEFLRGKRPELFVLDCPEDIYGEAGWRVYTHFYNSISYEEGCEISVAFYMDQLSGDKAVVEIELPLSAGKTEESQESEYILLPELDKDSRDFSRGALSWEEDPENCRWFRMPFEEEKVNWHKGDREASKNKRTAKHNTYVTAVGVCHLVFWDDNGSKRYSLFTNPSPDIKEDQYDRMIDDLVRIYEDAVYLDSSNQTMGKKYDSSEEQLFDQICRIEHILERISIDPERDLSREYSKKPLYKIRSFRPGAIADLGKENTNRISTVINRESYDLYEHRMIRQWLDKAGRYAQKSLDRLNDVNDPDIGDDQVDEDYKKIKDLVEKEEKDFDEIIKKWLSEFQKTKKGLYKYENEPQIRAEIQKAKNGFDLSTDNSFIHKKKSSYTYKSSTSLKISGNYDFIRDLKYFTGDNPGESYGTQYNIHFRICTWSNIEDFLNPFYFVYLMSEINRQNKDIVLSGTGRIEKGPLKKDGYPSCVSVEFWHINEATVKNEEEIFKMNFDDFVRKILEEDISCPFEIIQTIRQEYIKSKIKNDEDAIQYSKFIRKRKDKERSEQTKEICNNIIKKCDRLLSYYEFLKIKDRGESLHATNLFLKGRYYKDIFSIMREIPNQFYGLDSYGQILTRVRAAQKVFEIWTLFSMLDFFLKTGFELEEKHAFTDYLENYFSNTKEPKGERFVLKRKICNETHEITVEVFYQPEVESREVTDSGGKGKKYTPDFIWKISSEKEYRYVILDTKYKDFNHQGERELINEILITALLKYRWAIEGGKLCDVDTGEILEREHILGSYIIHPDFEYKFFNDLNVDGNTLSALGYYGQKADVFVKNAIMSGHDYDHLPGLPGVDKDFFPETKEYMVYGEEDDYGVNDSLESAVETDLLNEFCFLKDFGSIGCIAVRPGQYDYMMNLFRMVMEHGFGLDEQVCWNCGSEDIEILPKDGVGSRYGCNNCGDEWIVTWCLDEDCRFRIRKHPLNYYIKKPGKKWNMICPCCGKSL